MKKIIITPILLLILVASTQAQSFRIGAKAGANMTKITGQPFKEGFELGYHLGVFSEIDFNGKLGIQPEVIWNQSNTKKGSFDNVLNKWQDSTSTIQLNYLTIPLLLRYNVGNLITLNVGPQFGILVNQHNTLLQNGKEAFKSGDFGMVGGLQLNLKMFRVYGRYNIGLNNINDIGTQEKWKNQQLQLGVGVRL